MKRVAFVGFMLALMLSHLPAQVTGEKAKIKVYVSHSGSDMVGSRVAYQLKETISASVRYGTGKDDDFMLTLKIVLVSLDPDIDNSGHSSAVAYSFILFPNFINYHSTSKIRIVGSNRVNEVASAIASEIDKVLEDDLDYAKTILSAYLKGWPSK